MFARVRFVLLSASVVAVVACGGGADDGGAVDEEPTTTVVDTPAATVAPSTTIVRWTSTDEILTTAPEQALPSVGSFADALRAENARLGATDDLDHDADDAGVGVTLSPGACTEVGFVSYFYEADVPLTESPAVGIQAPAVQVYVCPDEAALAEQAAGLREIHAGTDGAPCPLAAADGEVAAAQVCEKRTTSGELVWWNALSLGTVELALVAVSGDLGPLTDPVAGGASMDALVDVAVAHLAERLG